MAWCNPVVDLNAVLAAESNKCGIALDSEHRNSVDKVLAWKIVLVSLVMGESPVTEIIDASS
jgi:hypothetical protein